MAGEGNSFHTNTRRSADCLAGFFLALSQAEREFANSLDNSIKGFFRSQRPSYFDGGSWKLMLAITDAVRGKVKEHQGIAYKISSRSGPVGNIKKWLADNFPRGNENRREEISEDKSLKLEEEKYKLFDSTCQEVGRLLNISNKIGEKLKGNWSEKKPKKVTPKDDDDAGKTILSVPLKKPGTCFGRSRIPVQVKQRKCIPAQSKSTPSQFENGRKSHVHSKISTPSKLENGEKSYVHSKRLTPPHDRHPSYHVNIMAQPPVKKPEKRTVKKRAGKPKQDLSETHLLSESSSSGEYLPSKPDIDQEKLRVEETSLSCGEKLRVEETPQSSGEKLRAEETSLLCGEKLKVEETSQLSKEKLRAEETCLLSGEKLKVEETSLLSREKLKVEETSLLSGDWITVEDSSMIVQIRAAENIPNECTKPIETCKTQCKETSETFNFIKTETKPPRDVGINKNIYVYAKEKHQGKKLNELSFKKDM